MDGGREMWTKEHGGGKGGKRGLHEGSRVSFKQGLFLSDFSLELQTGESLCWKNKPI